MIPTRIELPFTEMGQLQEGHVWGGGEEDQEFGFQHVTFEMPC